MTKIARCCCGSLRAETAADPIIVSACHCRECQRRTGAPFGVSAYFRKDDVTTAGTSTVYVRDGQEGRKIRAHFCPTCGTTLYWFADLRPDFIGIALGTFADPSFPKPTRSVWEEARHEWVVFGHDMERFAQAAVR